MLDAKPADDDVEDGEDEDGDGGRVVEDVSRAVVVLAGNVQTSQDQQDHTKKDLENDGLRPVVSKTLTRFKNHKKPSNCHTSLF